MGLNSKRNFALLFSDTILFTNAMTYLSVTTVITYFLITLEASTFQISLANILVSVGTFVSQPYFAKKAAELPLKSKYFSIILIIQRLFLLSSIIAIPRLIKISYNLTIITFLICWGIYSCGFMLSGSILIMRCGPQAKIPTYFLIYNIIALVISSILTITSSFLIDAFSFVPLFTITGIAALGSLIIFAYYNPVNEK